MTKQSDDSGIERRESSGKYSMKVNSVSLETRLLFVDEDKNIRHLFCENLHDENLLIQTASDNREALEGLKNFPADIVMLCIEMV